MSFPFQQAPTIQEFIDGLIAGHGCELHTLPAEVQLFGPRGPISVQYLLRNVEGGILTSEPLPEDLQDRLSPDTARRLIVQLKLSATAWMWAGDPYKYPFDD